MTQRLTAETLEGTWRWISSTGGPTDAPNTPEACGCERFLELQRNGRYELVERDSLAEYELCAGNYVVQPQTGRLLRAEGDRDGADAWVSFVGWWIDYEREQLVWFAGRDTLFAYPGTAAVTVSGAMTRRFVRETASNRSARARQKLRHRPLRDRPGRPVLDRLPASDLSYQ